MTGRRWRRVLPLAISAIVALVSLSGRVSTTEAAWTDSESGSGALSAMVVPPPVIVSCSGTSGLLGADPVMTLVWALPNGGYSQSAVRYFGGPGGLLPVLLSPLLGSSSTVVGPGAGQFTSTFSSGILTTLLSGRYTVALAIEFNEWQSVRVGRTVTFAALGGPATCAPPG